MLSKIFAAVVLAVTLVFVGAQTNTAEANQGFQVVGIRTYLSIREEPTTYSHELARVPNGTILYCRYDRGGHIILQSNGFYGVFYNGIEGWASSRYLEHIIF